MLLIVTPLVFSAYETGHHHALVTLSISVQSLCNGTLVTVTDGTNPVPGAQVSVLDVAAGPIFSGNTDANGQFIFKDCSRTVRIYASKEGYYPSDVTQVLVDCAQCGPTGGGCSVDANCPSDSQCSAGSCVPVSCPNGEVRDHNCVPYQCTSDAQCSAGEKCTDHSCQSQCNPPGCCTSDSQCSDSQNCLMATGAPASGGSRGACHDITGCGSVSNHALVPYECGSGPGCKACQSGYACIDNKCLLVEVTCPASGKAGDQVTCTATVGGQPCKSCDFEYTDPSGKKTTGKTDENGNFVIPLDLVGIYSASLLEGGNIVRSIMVQVNPAAPAGGAAAPTAQPGGFDLLSMLWILVLLLLVIIVIVVFLARGGRKK
jgi:hypothetical protein